MSKYNNESTHELSFRGDALAKMFEREKWPKTRLMNALGHTSFLSINKWLNGGLIPVNCMCKICNAFGIELFLEFFAIDGKPINARLTDEGIIEKHESPAIETPITEPTNISSSIIRSQEMLINQQQALISQLQEELKTLRTSNGQIGIRYGSQIVADDNEVAMK